MAAYFAGQRPAERYQQQDRGHLTAKLAVAITRTRQPNPGRAAALGLEALRIVHDTGSARIMSELRVLDARLHHRWPDHPASRSLRDAGGLSLGGRT